jgi:hypothetical protein
MPTARRRNPSPTQAQVEAYLAFVSRIHEILSEAGAAPLGRLDPRFPSISLDDIDFQFAPYGGYGFSEDDPSYPYPKVHASTMEGGDDFPESGGKVGWTHDVTPEEVAEAIVEYCQSRRGSVLRGRRSELTFRKRNPRRRAPARRRR